MAMENMLSGSESVANGSQATSLPLRLREMPKIV
jgi:hypothetical protein